MKTQSNMTVTKDNREIKPTPPNGMDIGNTLTLRFIGEAIVYLADTIRLVSQPKYIIKKNENKI